MSYTIEELLEAVENRLDADELLDILDLDMEELVEYLADAIIEQRKKFIDRLDLGDDDELGI